MRFVHVVLAVVLATALTGCGEGDGPDTPATGTDARPAPLPSVAPSDVPARIVIENFAFSPASLRVRVGQEITVLNRDAVTHTVTSTDDVFDTGDVGKGQTTTFRVSQPGEYPYICTPHQYMTGMLTVS